MHTGHTITTTKTKGMRVELITSNPEPGEQDITAHVNWDDLLAAGGTEGWEKVGLWSLTEFLARAGIAEVVENQGLGIEAELNADTLIRRQELKRLLDPDGMGVDLKVLVQGVGETGVAIEKALSGGLFGAEGAGRR